MNLRAEVFNANGDSHVYDVNDKLILIVKGNQSYDLIPPVEEGDTFDKGWIDDEDDEGYVALADPSLLEWDEEPGDEVHFTNMEGKIHKLDIDGDTLMVSSPDDLKPIDKVVVWCSDGSDVEFKTSYQTRNNRIIRTKIVVSG